MNTPVVDFVRRYGESGISRLHMPGHKGQPFLGFENWDITEIQGADTLFEADGILRESEENATGLFGSRRTFYSTEGSSHCIRAMLYLALTNRPAGAAPLVAAARNVHRAFVSAAALLDLEVAWLWPEESRSLCGCPISPRQLEETLKRLPAPPAAVYLTSPDYLGGMGEIAALSQVCHRFGTLLAVDNAHGAYLHFLPGGSRHPIDLGADLCCDSAHKTLPVLTGGAYLHVGRGLLAPAPEAVRGAMCLFGSTSPSYLILQSLDLCAVALAGDWPARLAACIGEVEALKRDLTALCPGLVRPSEPLKVVLDGGALGCTGQALADLLRACKVECEYADRQYVVLMFAPDNLPRDYGRVRQAAAKALRRRAPGAALPALPAGIWARLAAEAAPRRTIRQAVFARQELVAAGQALGRVCALPTVACPPAIPIAVSGEAIGPAAVELFRLYGVEQVAVTTE